MGIFGWDDMGGDGSSHMGGRRQRLIAWKRSWGGLYGTAWAAVGGYIF
jgi:hypothetical protein